jgi:glycosyltransferase involved in cell wall biosynthesis
MRLQFLRNRGLGPASLVARAQGKGRPQFSRGKLKAFVKDMDRRPSIILPLEPPRSIALVVPCFGHAGHLPRALDSIASQTRPPDEIVFVDDCSPDSTGEILRTFADAHASGPRSQVLVNERNLGQAASLNRGIEATESDLVMILNDDDYLMHDAVESALALYAEHPGLALIGAVHVGFSGDEALAAEARTSRAHAVDGPPILLHTPQEVRGYRYVDELDMTHSGLSFRRAAWQAVGGYETDKPKRVTPYSDRDFQLRVAALWPTGVVRTRPFAFWRNDSSIDGPRNS